MVTSILRYVLGERFCANQFKILNIGTGAGILENMLSEELPSSIVYSVDVVDERIEKEGYKFLKVKDERLPFSSDFFDLVISNNVIEHVNSPAKHIAEIYRVVKKKGVVYLSAPNKYWWLEHHFRVPFLSFLPKKISNLFCKLLFKKNFNINLYGYLGLRKIISINFDKLTHFTPIILKNPEIYSISLPPVIGKIVRHLPIKILEISSYLMPSFVFILEKE